MKTPFPRYLFLFLLIALMTFSCGLPDFGGDNVELGEEYISEEGGFAFQVIPGYDIEEFYGLVVMLAPGADGDVGPGITFLGGINEDQKTSEQLMDDFENGLTEDSEFGKPREVKVFGIKGLSVDGKTSKNGKDVYLRVVIVAVSPTQMFTMLGIYPDKNWEKEYGDVFNAVLESVHFFVPVESEPADEQMEEQPFNQQEVPLVTEGGEIRQWASTAKAGSQYSSPGWAAQQATGSPDTPDCGDHETAWASAEKYSVEWLEVGYDIPVTPGEVNIYETHTPSQIVKVELLDTAGMYHEIYTAAPKLEDCPFILSVPISGADYQAAAVKITVDQSKLNLPWDEIDAVELVGIATGGEPPQAQPPQQPETQPDDDTQDAVIPTSNPDQAASYSLTYSGTYEDSEEGDNIEVSVHDDRIDIRFKGENGRYLLLTLPPQLPDNFSVDSLSPFALEGRGPTSAGYYLRSVWYFGTENGSVSTNYNPDGTLSGQAQFEAITAHNATLYINLAFDHVPLDK